MNFHIPTRHLGILISSALIPSALHAAPGWTMEKFTGISGPAISNLTGAASFYGAPAETTVLTAASIPSNTGDNYGTRIRGYITAPVTGDYTFWESGNAAVQIFLSPDENPASKQLIAAHSGGTLVGQWDKYPSQQSRPIPLVAGSRYYVEVLHKAGTGSDHLAIAWTVPGASREPIPLSVMDTFDIGVPATPNGLTLETYGGISGSYVSDLTDATTFPHSPSAISILPTGQGPTNAGDDIGSRTRGWVVPQYSGNYTFWVSGDSRVELLLSPSANPADSQKIASCGGSTASLQWTKYASQKSRTLPLEAGKAYYLEILHKESTGDDHFAVAWTPPGGSLEILPNAVLRTWAPHASDLDNDNIADAQENALGLDPSNPADGFGDSDDDGIPNFREYAQFSKPTALDSVNGYLNDHVWYGISGDKLTDMCYKAAATRPHDARFFLTTSQSDDVGDNYVRRYRGFITAPLTGQYQFWLTADDDGDLYLSNSESKFDLVHIIRADVLGGAVRAFDLDPSQKSVLISLQAGQKYYFEMWHKESTMSGDAGLAWKIPGGTRQLIPQNFLSSFAVDPDDLDDDGLPDSYEIANGLDIQSDGRSPGSSQGAYGDLDGDGLTNYEEWKSNTGANYVDSDGDGVSDYDEVHFFGSATLANAIGPFTPVAALDGSDYISSLGEWEQVANTAHQNCVRGSVTYPVTVATSGIYAVKFHITSIVDGTKSEQYDFDLKLDGKRIAYKTINILPEKSGVLAVLSPWLKAGETYNFELFVDNSYNWRRVSIDRLEILAAGGIDSNNNGTPDWVDIRVHTTNGFDHTSILSKTSPATVEGNAKYYELVDTNGTPITQAPNGRFFTELPLSPGVASTLDFSFENGAVTQSANGQWLPTNLLLENSITIREGDSLLLTAYLDAENASMESYTITANGQTITGSADQPSQVLFNTSGVSDIQLVHTGSDGTVTQRTISVTVLALVSVESPLCITGYPRTWTHPTLPAGVSLHFDQQITSRQEASTSTYTLGTSIPVNSALLIRQGAAGPILGAGVVKSASIRSTDMTGPLVISSDTIHQIIEMPVISYGDIGNAEIRCHIIIGGVTYLDGTTSQSIFKQDFDIFDKCILKFKKPKSAHSNCHRFEVLHDNLNILH